MVNNILIGSVNSAPTYKEMEVIDDLPVKVNLEKYLLSLEKIIYFVNSHRLYVDLNLNFGIFLVNGKAFDNNGFLCDFLFITKFLEKYI